MSATSDPYDPYGNTTPGTHLVPKDKVSLEDFVLIKVIGKGSYGKVGCGRGYVV